MGLPQRLRLRRSEDFERLRQTGRTYRQRLMLVNAAPNEVGHNRYGFVTGKRLGNAVVRNRVRRLLQASIRALHPRLRVGYDLVIVAHPAAVGQPLTTIQRTVIELMSQADLLTDTDVESVLP
ncbi:MAG: ribonuclease P protein component [Anaerolineae bacterium]|nr:ribonuclease P protein component [Anaerolineae bacterium]